MHEPLPLRTTWSVRREPEAWCFLLYIYIYTSAYPCTEHGGSDRPESCHACGQRIFSFFLGGGHSKAVPMQQNKRSACAA